MGVVAVDLKEFARFVLTGLTATLGNYAMFRLIRHNAMFEVALVAGVATGLTISFLMSKAFAFGSRSWRHAPGEAVRFLVVYACGFALYLVAANIVRRYAPIYGIGENIAEALGILAGAGMMMVTSYFGHRFFTYRSYKRNAGRGRFVS